VRTKASLWNRELDERGGGKALQKTIEKYVKPPTGHPLISGGCTVFVTGNRGRGRAYGFSYLLGVGPEVAQSNKKKKEVVLTKWTLGLKSEVRPGQTRRTKQGLSS